jgi:hypothetical protein
MAFFDEQHVITCEGVVIWDGLTKPDEIESKPGSFSHNLRIAVKPGQPELAELEQLVQAALNASTEFKGKMPHGGNHPISPVDPAKFPELPGYVAFSAGTRLGAPEVVDANGATLQPMAYGRQIYNGTIVKLLLHAYAYSNKQKGVNFGLDGVQIIDATAPRLAIGAAGLSADKVKSAFTSQPTVASSAPPAVDDAPPPPPVESHTAYMDPPAAVWPPEGWKQNPNGPGWWYNTTTKEQLKEADLRARVGA